MFSHLDVAIHSNLFSSGKSFPTVTLTHLLKYLSCFASIFNYDFLTVPNRFKKKDILTDFYSEILSLKNLKSKIDKAECRNNLIIKSQV